MHFLKTNQHFAGLWFLHGWTWGRLVTDVTESRFWTMDMWVCLKSLGKILNMESHHFRRKTSIFDRYTRQVPHFQTQPCFRVIIPTSAIEDGICWAPLSWLWRSFHNFASLRFATRWKIRNLDQNVPWKATETKTLTEIHTVPQYWSFKGPFGQLKGQLSKRTGPMPGPKAPVP